MHGGFSKRVKANPQGCRGKYLDETPKKQALHHEIDLDAKRKRRKRGANAKNYVRPRELERVFRDRYGAILPDDDAGLDDIFVMANHLAHLDRPDKRIACWLERWAPWYGDDKTEALIEAVLARPLKWTADPMAKRLGLNEATRSRLGLTTIGAIDCSKAKRAKLRAKRNNEAKRVRRAEAGAKPHAASVEQAKPWLALGISRPTYFRRQKAARNETRETDSGTAYAKHKVLKPKQSQRATAAPPRGAVHAMVLPVSETGMLARVLVERIAANMRESIKLQSSLHTQFAPESFILTSRCA
jgi:hypothetical protein